MFCYHPVAIRDRLPLEQAHEAACRLAAAWLPQRPVDQFELISIQVR